ncbi:hypothetical protein DFH06DRAFT_1219337 [Mycena polygramma]|nr:hypothetical protein DFH06DRAFT_1219337 [Mycena polygramma]
MPRSALPSLGAWVVSTINQAATLEELDDHEALLSGKQLVTKPYIAFVKNIEEMYNPTEPYHTYTIVFLLHGLPHDDPTNIVDSSMCQFFQLWTTQHRDNLFVGRTHYLGITDIFPPFLR